MPLAYRTKSTSSSDLSGKRAHHRIAAPKFFAVPYNRLAEEGETVQFQCAVAGHPLPWSTWDRDGIIVMQTGRITVKEHDDLRTLEIEHVTAEDAGLYRITIENEYGRMEATARLDVLAARRTSGRSTMRASASPGRSITSSRRIMGASTRIGGRLVLACNYRGSSVPTARKFFHNGEEVPDDGGLTDSRVRIEHAGDRSTLVVDNVCAADAGLYTCLGQNVHGAMAASSTAVAFDEHTATPKPPQFGKPLPVRQSCVEGAPVDLCCQLRHIAEPFDMQWWRNGELVPDSAEFSYNDHGDGLLALRICDPFDMDAGEYVCRVRTASGQTCETSGRLTVEECARRGVATEEDDESALCFVKSPVPVMAVQGAVVTFCAKVWPVRAHVGWSICGREVNDATRGIMVSVCVCVV